MSKIQLKKELLKLDREQIIELLLEAYAARKEIKDYFDYFCDPDVEKLTEKYRTRIKKELTRVKRGNYSKCRISVLKTLLKEYISYQPGAEEVVGLYCETITLALELERYIHFSDILIRGVCRLLTDLLDYAENQGVYTAAIDRLDDLLVKNPKGTYFFRSQLLAAITEYAAR